MLKATSHAKTKRKIHLCEQAPTVYLSFWIYTATAVHEVDAARLRMRMAQLLGTCSQRCIFLFGFIRRQPYIRRHFSVCEWVWP